MQRAYLDHAATSPLRPVARAAMLRVLDEVPGNPSSIHIEGQAARLVLDEARRQVADLLAVRAERVVFTSGGTEANNLALAGVMRSVMAAQPGKRLLLSAVEHDCVRNAAIALMAAGVPVTMLPVDGQGVLRLGALQAELVRGNVGLVSVMLVNNENGVVQPVGEAAALARQAGALVHTDAIQAVGHLEGCAPDALGVDMLSVSAHKLGGPTGVGALVVRPEMAEHGRMQALLHGGGQERNRRAGTENVAGICAFGAVAAELLRVGAQERATQAGLMAVLVQGIRDLGLRIVGDGAERAGHIVQVLVPGSGEDAVIALDMRGVAASRGSACSSGRVTASPVLQAMGYGADDCLRGLRLSLGWNSTQDDVRQALAALQALVKNA